MLNMIVALNAKMLTSSCLLRDNVLCLIWLIKSQTKSGSQMCVLLSPLSDHVANKVEFV